MDYDDLIEGVTGLAPQAQFFMLVLIANNLREAVNQGHLSPAVLTQALDHLKMLVEIDPGATRQ